MPQYPVRIVIISFLTPKDGDIKLLAFQTGGTDFVTKPGIDIAREIFNYWTTPLKIQIASKAPLIKAVRRSKSNQTF